VSGRVVIPASVPAFSAGTLRVWLEDVSYADRAAVVVAGATIAGVSHAPQPVGQEHRGTTVIAFGLQPTHDLDPASDYSVRVSLDVPAGAGRDALVVENDRSYPVLTRGHGSDVTVVLDTSQRPQRGAL